MTTKPEQDEKTEQTQGGSTITDPDAKFEPNDAHQIDDDDPEPPDTFPTDVAD